MPGGPEAHEVAQVNPAEKPLGSMMPEAEQLSKGKKKEKMRSEFTPQEFTEKEMEEKVGKKRKEITGADKEAFSDIIAQAKKAIAESAVDGKVIHGDAKKFDIDGTNYVYLRDESQKDMDRLFKTS